MAELKDVMAYLIAKYPLHQRGELSKARLTKLIYLSDWHQAINHGKQITQICWYFDNYGPYVKDVEQEAVINSDIFVIDLGNNKYGQPKVTIGLRDEAYQPNLQDFEKLSIDHIIEATRKLYWNDFIKLVYATFPIASSERYSPLDLIQKAKDYAEISN